LLLFADVRAGSLKSVLRLLFNLSCYKQQLQRGGGQAAAAAAAAARGASCGDGAGGGVAAPGLSDGSAESPAMLSR